MLPRFCIIVAITIMLPTAFGFAYFVDLQDKEKRLYQMPADTAKANLLIALGEYYSGRDLERALLYLQEALVISTEHNYKKGIAGSYLYQGRSYYYKDQYGIAFEYLENARRLYEELQDKNGLANYHFATGSINAIIGNHLNAIQDFQAVITYSEAVDELTLMSLGYLSLGGLHINRKEAALAMSYLNEALSLALETGNQGMVANVMTNIGQTYELTGKPDSALYFMNKGLEIRQQLQEERGIASSGLIIGNTLISMGHYTEAVEMLRNSESVFSDLNDDTGISIALMRVSQALSFLGKTDKAKKEAEHALALSLKIGNPNLTGEAYATLASIHARADNYKNAYNYTLMLNHLRDSLAEANKERIISELEIRFQTARKDDRIMLLEAQYEIRRKNNILLTVSIAALGAILLLILVLYRFSIIGLRRQQKLLEQEQTIRLQESELKDKEQLILKKQLESKNRELASKALEMLRINETIDSIIAKLDEYSRNNRSNNQLTHQIRSIISGLESQLRNNTWNEFEKIFNNIHTAFFTKLLEVCPELTPTEIKIAALLKLNLTTKEIAALTYKSEAGIKSTRYRLRKKLHLNSDNSLITYLMQL